MGQSTCVFVSRCRTVVLDIAPHARSHSTFRPVTVKSKSKLELIHSLTKIGAPKSRRLGGLCNKSTHLRAQCSVYNSRFELGQTTTLEQSQNSNKHLQCLLELQRRRGRIRAFLTRQAQVGNCPRASALIMRLREDRDHYDSRLCEDVRRVPAVPSVELIVCFLTVTTIGQS